MDRAINSVVPSASRRSQKPTDLFNLGLIALITPVTVPDTVRWFDWPFLVVSTGVATVFLWTGQLSRAGGILLVLLFGVFVAVHLVIL